MDPWHAIHQRFNWTNKSQPTSWLNKLPLSWSLMIYGGCACRCCASAEFQPKVGTLAGAGGVGLIASLRGAIDRFLLAPRCVRELRLMRVPTELRSGRRFFNIPRLIWATTGNHTRAPANNSVGPKKHKGLASFMVTGACTGECARAARRTVFFLRKTPAHLQDGWLFGRTAEPKRKFNA